MKQDGNSKKLLDALIASKENLEKKIKQIQRDERLNEQEKLINKFFKAKDSDTYVHVIKAMPESLSPWCLCFCDNRFKIPKGINIEFFESDAYFDYYTKGYCLDDHIEITAKEFFDNFDRVFCKIKEARSKGILRSGRNKNCKKK